MGRTRGEFPFDRARRLTPAERAEARKAIEKRLGKKLPKRGRPPKPADERAKAISIRLHPGVILWAKAEAAKRGPGVGYQTVINETLAKRAGVKFVKPPLRGRGASTDGGRATPSRARRSKGAV